MIAGRGPSPVEVIMLIKRLPDDSLTAALASGNEKTFGWGTERHLLASIYDAINQNTRASGNWGKRKPPKIDPFPRPTEAAKKAVKSVADLFANFAGPKQGRQKD